MEVRESQIEDVFATYPRILQETLGLPYELSILFRQYEVPAGKLDLLCAGANRLLLIELKVEPFRSQFIQQVKGYLNDLHQLQASDRLINIPIEAYLLCPSFGPREMDECQKEQIFPAEYSPERVLTAFFQQLRTVASFVAIKPSDHGVWNIHLTHRALYLLRDASDPKAIAKTTGLSSKTVGNHFRLCEELGLMRTIKGRHYLTDLGIRYVAGRDPSYPDRYLSEEQAALLRDFIVKDPFASPAIFGIYSIVECVFTLARNEYPVKVADVLDYFRETVGKRKIWVRDKSSFHGTKMYSNYAYELGLLGKVHDKFLLTPEGMRFVLLLQLHKGIKVVDALREKQ
ncbi:MAG: hypothetical protein AB1696_07890 [Planctomycetota bacterium]